MNKKKFYLFFLIVIIAVSAVLLVVLYKSNRGTLENKPSKQEETLNSQVNENGTIFAIGGQDKGSASVTNTAEFYNLKTNKWEMLPSTLNPHTGASAAISENKIYIFGGDIGNVGGGSKIVEEFDFSTNEWSLKKEMPHRLTNSQAVSLGGKIYVFGGQDNGLKNNTMDIYNPSSDIWTTGPTFPVNIENYHGPWCQPADAKIYCPVLGEHAYTLVYDPSQNDWASLPTEDRKILYNPSWASTGKVLYGATFFSKGNEIDMYDPSIDKLTVREAGNYIHNSYQGFTPVVVGEDFYLVGGEFTGPPVRDVYIFNLKTSTSWKKTTPMIVPRSGAAVVFTPISYLGRAMEGGYIGGRITKNGKPVSGRLIQVYLNREDIISTTQTDAEGYYSFYSLAPGVYHVEIESVAGDSSYGVGYDKEGNSVPSFTDITFNFKKQTSGITLAKDKVINNLNYGVDWPSNYQDIPEKYVNPAIEENKTKPLQ